jgi:DNA polymerase
MELLALVAVVSPTTSVAAAQSHGGGTTQVALMKPMTETAAPYVPHTSSLAKVRSAARACEGCELYKKATQTVFGEGAEKATVIFVGEQPGDIEDREGHPFVGPAGKLLHKLMAQAGIDESKAYLTNAVKHFNFEERGTRRLHAKPRPLHINACNPWLEAEVEHIQPKLIVALGATAARAVIGKNVTISKIRGTLIDSAFGTKAYVTIHPSAILRMPDHESRVAATREFIADLKKIAKLM